MTHVMHPTSVSYFRTPIHRIAQHAQGVLMSIHHNDEAVEHFGKIEYRGYPDAVLRDHTMQHIEIVLNGL